MCKVRLGRLYDRQQGLCIICGEWALLGINPNSKKSPTIEHIIPKSENGVNSQTNLCMAHQICNTNRGDGELKYNQYVFELLPRNKKALIKRFNRDLGIKNMIKISNRTKKKKIRKKRGHRR